MWTKAQLVEDLRELGLREGGNVLAHTSLRSIGKIEGGAETLVAAFREVLGPTGTLLVPTFTFDHVDPTSSEHRDASPTDLERMRTLVPPYEEALPASSVRWTGVFPDVVRQQPDSVSSHHPLVSFAAIGANAAFVTQNAPYHYPLGSNSPLARLHQIGGDILLIGVSHRVNTSLYLAEIWADVPYIHRSCRLKMGVSSSYLRDTEVIEDSTIDVNEIRGLAEWATIKGSPECSEGFAKIESLLRQARVLKTGTLGNAPCQRMQQRAVVSMAVAMLSGDSAALLCSRPDCTPCAIARKFTAEQWK